MQQDTLTLADGTRIQKRLYIKGEWGRKPTEESECHVKITSLVVPDVAKFDDSTVKIGHGDGEMGRTLDECLMSMNEGEMAEFVLPPLEGDGAEERSFSVNLMRVINNGLIYQWDAQRKMEIALTHKEKGVELFKQNREKDAAYRFTKALKIACSIPIDVEAPPEEIDGVSVKVINQLKANLFNNLASFYLKKQQWSMVIDVCKKVFSLEKDNVKAHYKIGLAYMRDRNFESAKKAFETVLEREPGNKAAADQLRHVNDEIRKATQQFNTLVKKMFV